MLISTLRLAILRLNTLSYEEESVLVVILLVPQKLTNSNIGFVAPRVLVSDGVKDPFYMCDKQKMNSPVLLPDGSLNICSFDYSLSQILGNLKTDKLSTIWNNYKERIMDPFLAGELHPCTKCEHYQLIEPLAP